MLNSLLQASLSKAQRLEILRQIDNEIRARGIDPVKARNAVLSANPKYDFEAMPAWMAQHPGQSEAWQVSARWLILLAGWQAGKTDFLVWWCLRQMKRRGPGEAIVYAPTYPLLMVAALPRLVRAIESRNLGEHKKGDNLLRIPYDSLRSMGYEGDTKGNLDVFFRHTSEAKHVEAITAQWAAGDEVGQMSDEVLEAVEGRLSATGGESLQISRPYFDNKFRTNCETQQSDRVVVNFASWHNPGWRADLDESAKKQEIERLKNSMPLWRFEMKFGGKFTRPAGAIIDNWKDEYEVSQFFVPGDWKRFTFHDFGNVHAFVIQAAEHPTEKDSEGYPVIYCYRETFKAQSTASIDIVRELLRAENEDMVAWSHATGNPVPKYKPRGIGGNPSTEEGWRESYTSAGIPVEKPLVGSIEAQIDRLYACVGRGGLRITKNCEHLLRMLKKWSWEIDDGGEPIPGKILNDAAFHGPAALRYGVSQLRPNKRELEQPKPAFPVGSIGQLHHAFQETDTWNG